MSAGRLPSRIVVARPPRRRDASGTAAPLSVTLAVGETGTVTILPSFSASVIELAVTVRIRPLSSR